MKNFFLVGVEALHAASDKLLLEKSNLTASHDPKYLPLLLLLRASNDAH